MKQLFGHYSLRLLRLSIFSMIGLGVFITASHVSMYNTLLAQDDFVRTKHIQSRYIQSRIISALAGAENPLPGSGKNPAFKPPTIQPVQLAPSEQELSNDVPTTQRLDAIILNNVPEQGHSGSDRAQEVISDTFNFNDELSNIRDLTSNKIYRSTKVPVRGRAIRQAAYDRVYKPEALERAKERLEQAATYLAAGNDETFVKILKDIIRQYHFSYHAATAAFELAQFYEKDNLQLAARYYTYIINIHTHSGYEEAALYHLAVMLDNARHYLKSEALLNYLVKFIQERRKKKPSYTSKWSKLAHDYLLDQYQSFIRWGELTEHEAVSTKYRKKIIKLKKLPLIIIPAETSPNIPTPPQPKVPEDDVSKSSPADNNPSSSKSSESGKPNPSTGPESPSSSQAPGGQVNENTPPQKQSQAQLQAPVPVPAPSSESNTTNNDAATSTE